MEIADGMKWVQNKEKKEKKTTKRNKRPQQLLQMTMIIIIIIIITTMINYGNEKEREIKTDVDHLLHLLPPLPHLFLK